MICVRSWNLFKTFGAQGRFSGRLGPSRFSKIKNQEWFKNKFSGTFKISKIGFGFLGFKNLHIRPPTLGLDLRDRDRTNLGYDGLGLGLSLVVFYQPRFSNLRGIRRKTFGTYYERCSVGRYKLKNPFSIVCCLPKKPCHCFGWCVPNGLCVGDIVTF